MNKFLLLLGIDHEINSQVLILKLRAGNLCPVWANNSSTKI